MSSIWGTGQSFNELVIFSPSERYLQRTHKNPAKRAGERKESDPFALSFVFQVLVALLFLAYTLITRTLSIPSLSGLLINFIMMTVFYSLGNILTFKAFKLAEVSEVSVIFASNSLWAVIASLVILGERLTISKGLGVLLVVCGLVAINYVKSSWKVNRGHLYALLGAALFGIAFVNDIFIIKHFNNVASYTMLAFAFPGIFGLAFSPKSIKRVPYFFDQYSIFPRLLICSVFYALAAFTIYQANKMGGLASVISPIVASSLVITVIISYIFLKERDRVWNKILGTLLTFGGILLLI